MSCFSALCEAPWSAAALAAALCQASLLAAPGGALTLDELARASSRDESGSKLSHSKAPCGAESMTKASPGLQ